MHAWHDVELGDDIEGGFRAVIEIPKGSKVKYELDKKSGLIKLGAEWFALSMLLIRTLKPLSARIFSSLSASTRM